MARRRKRKFKGVSPDHREPNGRHERDAAPAQAREMRSVAVEARQRVYDLPEEIAETKEAGSAAGRLYRNGLLTREQFDAVETFAEIRRDYERAILIRRMGSSSDLNRRGGYDGSDGTEPSYVAFYDRAKGRYERARRAILMTHDHFAMLAIEAVANDESEMWEFVGSTRIAANAVAHEFRDELLGEKEDAA